LLSAFGWAKSYTPKNPEKERKKENKYEPPFDVIQRWYD
jgi:hypothetical protein